MNQRCVSVLIADAKFLSPIYSIQLFPQGMIGQIIEVKASDEISAVCRVGVRPGHGPQPLAERDHIRSVDLMLPLMSEIHLFIHTLSVDLTKPCNIIPFVAETSLKKPVNIS